MTPVFLMDCFLALRPEAKAVEAQAARAVVVKKAKAVPTPTGRWY